MEKQTTAYTELTGYDQRTGCSRCLLVTSWKRRDGILVNSVGCYLVRKRARAPAKQPHKTEGQTR